jgi:hypothetical protein
MECELAIKNGFAEAGKAFKEIRDERLYKEKYSRFEDYCREVHGIGRTVIHKIIAASDVVDNLLQNLQQNIPTSAGVANELAGLSPDMQGKVWKEAVKTAPNKKPTAKHVKDTKMIMLPSYKQKLEVERRELERMQNAGYSEFEIAFAKRWQTLVRKHIKQHDYIQMGEMAEKMIGRISVDYPDKNNPIENKVS